MSNSLEYQIGKRILYEKSTNNYVEGFIINFNDPQAYRFKSANILYIDSPEEYKYEQDINLSKITNIVPEFIFTLGRMNPPTPGHINGLIIPLLKYVAQRILFTITNNFNQIKDILNSMDDFTNKEEIVTLIDKKYQSVNNLSVDEFNLKDMQDFISENSNLANIYYKVYLTSTTNSSRIYRAKNNDQKMESLLQEISNPNSEGEIKFSSQNKKLLENPLILVEKTYFLYQMLNKSGIDNQDILNNICLSNIHEKFCAVFGIKSAIRCAIQAQIEISKGNFDSNNIIYIRGDDGENADNRIKFCIDPSNMDDNILNLNDEPPSVSCETLPRITFEGEEISATRIRSPYLNYQNEEKGSQNLYQVYNNYLDENDLFCLNSILANRLIFPNLTIPGIIQVIENQSISNKCDYIYRWGAENLDKRITRSQKKLILITKGPGADKISRAISELFKKFDDQGKEIEIKKEEELLKIKEMEEELKKKSRILEDDLIENKLQKQDEIDFKERNKSKLGGKKTKREKNNKYNNKTKKRNPIF
jgi:hypothetical protein